MCGNYNPHTHVKAAKGAKGTFLVKILHCQFGVLEILSFKSNLCMTRRRPSRDKIGVLRNEN
jgi:hypothetical protein